MKYISHRNIILFHFSANNGLWVKSYITAWVNTDITDQKHRERDAANM